jgi:hypothetical protein
MIFRGRRFSLTTQTRWPWQIRVPMGGTYIMTEVIPGGAYRLQEKKTGK